MKLRLTERDLIELVKRITEQVEEDENPRLLNVPHYLQSDDSTCGPASLRMVMAYYGLKMTEEDIAGACGHTYELGCRSEDMACAAENLGFDVHLKNNSTIEELSKLVNAGAPVIVDWFCGDPPEGHSSVVIGATDKNLYILDPFLEEMRVVSKYDFRRCWFDFYETPISPNNLYVGQIMVLRPKKNFNVEDIEKIEESELKERCWKGYTQKGSKMMFGKRYPNCVKAKKTMKEYFDPIQFLKKKFKKEIEGVRPEELKKYEPEVQKLVDILFKMTSRKNKLEHLKGLKVLKVTPEGNGWTVLLKPLTSSWWNYSNNKTYQKKLDNFMNDFREATHFRAITGPEYRNYPNKLNFNLWLG